MNQRQKIMRFYQKKRQVDTFDERSERFPHQRYRNRIESNFLKRVIKRVINRHNRKIKILDVACGTGRFLSTLFPSKKEIEYTGLDSSKAMLDKVKKKKLFLDNKKNISLVLSNVEKIPFKDNTFDIIYTFHFLWHIPKEDQKKIILEMMRVLKKGGYLVFDVINKDFIWGKLKRLFKEIKTSNVYKLNLKEIQELTKREVSFEGIVPFPVKNPFIYSFFNIFNELRYIFPKSVFYMLFVSIKK